MGTINRGDAIGGDGHIGGGDAMTLCGTFSKCTMRATMRLPQCELIETVSHPSVVGVRGHRDVTIGSAGSSWLCASLMVVNGKCDHSL